MATGFRGRFWALSDLSYLEEHAEDDLKITQVSFCAIEMVTPGTW